MASFLLSVLGTCNKGNELSLTPKQEAFARAYVETSNASEAYRRSYNAGNMKPAVIAVKACELLASGNVSVRVKELQEELRERHKVTIDDLITELEDARTCARGSDKPQAAAMVAATMGKAKLLGFLDAKAEDDESVPVPVKVVVQVQDARKPDAKS